MPSKGMNNIFVPLPLPSPFGAGANETEDRDRADVLFAVKYPLHILVADESYICRRVLILMLQRLGYTVDSVETGADCLRAAKASPYDLILLDIDLPVMDGVECTRNLRRAGVQSSIVAVTATPPEFAHLECLTAGMNGYIEKPLITNDLKRALRLAYLGHIFAAA